MCKFAPISSPIWYEVQPIMFEEKWELFNFEDSRRWATRFLGLLCHIRPVDFHKWGIQLLLRQLADESVKVKIILLKNLANFLIFPIFLTRTGFPGCKTCNSSSSYLVTGKFENDFPRRSFFTKFYLKTAHHQDG